MELRYSFHHKLKVKDVEKIEDSWQLVFKLSGPLVLLKKVFIYFSVCDDAKPNNPLMLTNFVNHVIDNC